MESLVDFFSGEGFIPHGHCFFWTPGLMWPNVSSDALNAGFCINPAIAGDRIMLSYRDDGRGIPEDSYGKVFERFFTVSRNRGGSGLGLHNLHNFVTETFQDPVRIENRPMAVACVSLWNSLVISCNLPE